MAAYSDTATNAQLENADLIMIEEDRKKENSLNSRPTPFPRPGSTHPSLPVSDLEQALSVVSPFEPVRSDVGRDH